MSGNEILAVKDLSAEYRKTQAGVKNLSFSINRGEVLGLVGESGSGKSTVCRAILGLLDERSVRLSGSIMLSRQEILPLGWDKRRGINGKKIGFIMQNPLVAFNPCLKVRDHFSETLCTLLPCSKKDAYICGADLLKKVGIKNEERIMKSYPHELSGGMLQRVMIAIAIALNPVLIVADEPTTALDTANQAVVLELLTFILKKYRPAMLLISHDMEVISEVADSVAVMKDGCIVEEGCIDAVLGNPKHAYTKELIRSCGYLGGI